MNSLSRRLISKRTPYALVVFITLSIAINAHSQATKYSKTPNKDLKTKALQLVKSIRGLVNTYQERDRELMFALDKRTRADIRPDEKKTLRDQWMRESGAVHDSSVREYKEKYWAEAILLRDELYRRLPKKAQQPNLAIVYQQPTNMLGIQTVADHLDLLTRSLPDE